ncbi:transcription termination factor NusA [Mycoplasma sp. ATU-Cv-703]|uniref:transcription termination factor NusA n=1 Tax=Mycoplasma sp. ATU-Cv-703 TaxID=2498595 RepID=UPI001374EA11
MIRKNKSVFDQEQFFAAIDLISKNNLIEKDEIFTIIRETIIRTFHTRYDPDARLELNIDPEKNLFQLLNHSVLVVEDEDFDPRNQAIEIGLTEALKIDKNIKVGQEISLQVSFQQFANQIKQLLTQTFRERKKQNIFDRHKDLVGQTVDATVVSISRKGDAVLSLSEGTNAYMPTSLRNLKIPLSIGERIKVFVEEVKREARESQIVVSNGSKEMVRQILQSEVPEIADGVVEIVALARIPGERSKVAVRSSDPNVDPVGAVIGPEGTRISAIVSKLEGEKIDIINYSSDIDKFVAHALEPAKIIAVQNKVDQYGRNVPNTKIAITPQVHQTLAIGRQGANVRLAVELTKVNIDILSLEQAREQNISFVWNGTLSENDLHRVSRTGRLPSESFDYRRSNHRSPRIDFTEIDDQIRSFQEDITEQSDEEEQPVRNFSADLETNFTDEELKKMEAEFDQDFGFNPSKDHDKDQ